MKKTLKIIAGLAGLVVLLVVLAAVVLPLIIDPNDYRDQIASRVEAATGRSMQIEGSLKLSVIPWLGVEIGKTRLGNPPGFGDQPFMEARAISVGARLLPLLSGRLEVSTVRVDGLRLNLIKAKNGQANWQGFGGTAAGKAEPESPAGEGPSLRLTGLAGLEMTDAQIRYQDLAAGSEFEADVPSLSTGEIVPGRPFEAKGEAELVAGAPPVTMSIRFEAAVHPAEDFSSVKVESLDVRASGHGAEDMHFDGELQAEGFGLTFDRLVGSAAKISLSASVSAAQDRTKQQVSLSAKTATYDLSRPSARLTDVEGTGAFEREGGDARNEISFSIPTMAVDLQSQVVTAPNLEAVVDGVKASGSLEGSGIVDAPRFKGAVQVEEFSPRELMKRLSVDVPPTADPSVLKAASFEGKFDASRDKASLDGMNLRLDDTGITGKASLGFGDPTRIEAALTVNAIDLDRYLAPAQEGQEKSAEEGSSSELAFEWLKGIAMDATLRIGRLKASGLTLTDLSARAVARDGVLTVEPVKAALYGGTLKGSARLDARESPAVFSLDESLTSLSLGPFVNDLAGFDKMQGSAKLDADLQTKARTTADLLSGLNGSIGFDVSDAVYQGVNVWYEIQSAWAKLKGLPAPEKASPDTAFRDIRGTAVIKDGVLSNNDLVAGMEALGLTGKGQVNLATRKLDYQLNAAVDKQAKDTATGKLSDLAGARLPLKITGDLADPSVSVDLGGMVKQEAEKQVLKKLGVEQDAGKSSEEALKDTAKERLKKLLGGGD